MSARLERYETASEWDRERLIQMSAADYAEWITLAHQARVDYLNGKVTAEEFLQAIDVHHELDSYTVDVSQPPDLENSPWRKQVAGSIDFDPAVRYEDIMFLDLGKGPAAQWETISAEKQIKAARMGCESLREKYGKSE